MMAAPASPACCPNCGHSFRGEGPISSAGLILDPLRREAIWLGQPARICPREFDVLEIIVRAGGQPVSRDSIMARLDSDGCAPTAQVHVCRLRQKLRGIPISTIFGSGYAWRPTEG
ncbi:winged helix-turn-helix domain-containing protein [Sphingomonas fennica]|uniref:OmpR/PhoB-type domain-containing protein n=1 Tax=Edaphosphingomonas fennica TaxID=114404 RepID=A0A2T4HVP4_9SPHN|nr:winged helix-turn-helix domain-containing protein [Sphingomonas fennica]PTD19884.1 hypothetical protein CV103_11895 [Sphingomonas fennica]